MTNNDGVKQEPLATGAVVALIGTLLAVYMVSQFLRNSVGVIAPNLAADIGVSAGEIGLLSSAFFFLFAGVQLPLGVALDRFGPRLCLLVGVAITVIGVVVFAGATSAGGLVAGRALLGLGCAGSLMAPLALYARHFPPHQFASLTGLQVGLGSVGTLVATAPLAYGTAAIGWRASFLWVAVFTVFAGLLVAIVIKGERTVSAKRHETWRENLAGLLAVIRTPSVGRLFLMNLTGYSSFALVVGLWGGPYLTHIYGYDITGRGTFLLLAAVAQIGGSLAWGPTDRLFGSYKIPTLIGAILTGTLYAVPAVVGTMGPVTLMVWFVLLGAASAYLPVTIAHGKSLFPRHLVGRGLTLFNMATMGGVFLTQFVTGLVIDLFPAEHGVYPLDAYRVVFALQAVFIFVTAALYSRAWDPRVSPRPGS
jgi:MFS family permease